MYTNIKSLRCIPETNVMLYANDISTKTIIKAIPIITRYPWKRGTRKPELVFDPFRVKSLGTPHRKFFLQIFVSLVPSFYYYHYYHHQLLLLKYYFLREILLFRVSLQHFYQVTLSLYPNFRFVLSVYLSLPEIIL